MIAKYKIVYKSYGVTNFAFADDIKKAEKIRKGLLELSHVNSVSEIIIQNNK